MDGPVAAAWAPSPLPPPPLQPPPITILYSGDCIPSTNLIRAGRRCTLLIHEATFARDRVKMARERKHSTVDQAIDVAVKMEAGATILTHFSQRYPKAVDIDDEQCRRLSVCTAFDGIDIDLGMLPHLKLLNDRIRRELERLALQKEEEDAREKAALMMPR